MFLPNDKSASSVKIICSLKQNIFVALKFLLRFYLTRLNLLQAKRFKICILFPSPGPYLDSLTVRREFTLFFQTLVIYYRKCGLPIDESPLQPFHTCSEHAHICLLQASLLGTREPHFTLERRRLLVCVVNFL